MPLTFGDKIRLTITFGGFALLWAADWRVGAGFTMILGPWILKELRGR